MGNLTFVGRRDALDAFELRFAYRHMKNGIYFCSRGGLGKTAILKKIIDDNSSGSNRVVAPIIDFSQSQHHSVHGLQSAIRAGLQLSQAFAPYDKILGELNDIRSRPNIQPSIISSLDARANKIFLECCQEAIVGRVVVLLFDTFERVQQRYVGQWLCQEFLPQVSDLIVAIAGRPEPAPALMADNVATFELQGLDREAFSGLIRQRLPSASDEVVETIWVHTDGTPLIAHLILDLHEPQRSEFLTKLSQLKENDVVQQIPDLKSWLVSQFANPPDNVNRVIWAMAHFRRRFDVAMLNYIVNNTIWFRPDDYERIFEDLSRLIYVKENPSQQSHLLHDEIQRMVAEYVLPYLGTWDEMREDLDNVIVNSYYPEAIRLAEKSLQNIEDLADSRLPAQLRAEQLGYILEHDREAGLAKYMAYRLEVETKTQDYDFEELLWGEVREYLSEWTKDKSYDISKDYDIYQDRGTWLRKHSLFHKAEEHYRQMLERLAINQIDTQQSYGFMLLRQGKVKDAQAVFEESRAQIAKDDFENIAMVENNLGQAAERAGQWTQALDYYARSFRAATDDHNSSGQLVVYINRGYLYSLQGKYVEAKQQCNQAIKLLNTLPSNRDNGRRSIYAWMNLGTAFRYSGDYVVAAKHYLRSLELASATHDDESITDVLQRIGSNEHLWGRELRREGAEADRAEACKHQQQSWEYLVKALEIAQRSDRHDAIADALNHLGKVYREIHRLRAVQLQNGRHLNELADLQQLALTYQPIFEVEHEHDLLTTKKFSDADWLEKSVRLFEISALVAEQAGYFHRALESWTEAARLFEELNIFEKVPFILRRISRTKGNDYQELVFDAVSELILGDLDYKRGNFDRALEKYKHAYTNLAEQPGYAAYLLSDRLRDLEWRLLALPHSIARYWCDSLEEEWLNRSLLTNRPDMLNTIERIRINLV